MVSNASPSEYRVAVLIFVPDLGWYSKPSCAQQTVPFTADGSFAVQIGLNSIADRTATAYAAYLVPAAYQPVCVTGPAEIPAALEAASVARVLMRRQDPNPRTLEFSGLTWVVKSRGSAREPIPLSPGPNRFSPDHVWVDNAGRLHLKIAPCGAYWCSAELYTLDDVGYGTYRAYVDHPVAALDPNAVLGLFTWSYEGGSHNREIDIEFSRWGNASAVFNAQYVVQPYNLDNHIRRFTMPAVASSTHTIGWQPGKATFQSVAGLDITGTPLQQWEFTGAGVPPPGRTSFHINFYLQGGVPPANPTAQEIVISRLEYTPAASNLSMTPTAVTVPHPESTTTASVTATSAACSWFAESESPWLSIGNPGTYSGSGNVVIEALANPGTPRFGDVRIHSSNCPVQPGSQRITVSQQGVFPCELTLYPLSTAANAAGGTVLLNMASSGAQCRWSVSSGAPWIVVNGQTSRIGSDIVEVTIAPNTGPGPRVGTVSIAGFTHTVTQQGTTPLAGLRFTPVTPCRVADTRNANGPFGGPSLPAAGQREFRVPQSNCAIPASARAYSLNVTVVPKEPLAYISLWPAASAQPLVSTLNAFRGEVVANAAIVPAGNGGGIVVFASHATDVVLDINGYFSESTALEALAFYPLTPCRIADTRGTFGPFGQPSFTSAAPFRDFALRAGPCNIPITARAYALNMTAVPRGNLGYLSTWPALQPRPLVSTLNSWDGRVLANAAIVPAGAGGAISVYTDLPTGSETDLVIDINGYFAPPGAGGLLYYPVTPCRLVDTRESWSRMSGFGAPPLYSGSVKGYPAVNGPCSLPWTVRALSLNATVVPHGSLSYLTLWPAGQMQPNVSTLNSFAGDVVANALIVPVPYGGGINAYALLGQPGQTTELILDVNGYFAP